MEIGTYQIKKSLGVGSHHMNLFKGFKKVWIQRLELENLSFVNKKDVSWIESDELCLTFSVKNNRGQRLEVYSFKKDKRVIIGHKAPLRVKLEILEGDLKKIKDRIRNFIETSEKNKLKLELGSLKIEIE